MSSTSFTIEQRRASLLTRALAYVELTKPRILVMVLLAVAVAAFAAGFGRPDVVVVLHALLGTTLVAGSASALNQWIERESDARMARTVDRPLPSNRLSPAEVLVGGSVSVVLGLLYLGLTVNPATVVWAALTWLIYVCVYTPLKKITVWNTLVGAIAGALPILIGWSVTADSVNIPALALFGILLLWQFPHFMAIAWLYRKQYQRAELQMFTVADATGRRAGRHAVGGAALALAVSLVPFGFASPTFYLVGALVLGLVQLLFAWRFAERLDDLSARRLLRCSLIYLPAMLGIFAAASCI